jgi:periplasmic protein TonB
MFEQSLLPKGKTRRPWTIAVAVLIEAAIVAVLVLLPLIYVQAIPMPDLVTALTLPPPPAPPPPPPAAPKMARVTPRKFNPQGLVAPHEIPEQVAQVNEPPIAAPDVPAIGGVMGGIPGGVPGGIVGGVIGSVPNIAPPPPPPPPPAKVEAAAPQRIHVGGQVQAAMIVNQVRPIYPKLASASRVGGVVRLKAVISKDGRINNLTLISGHPLLVQAAMDAVRQWTYKPTVLNGNPVEVDTEIDVNFTLSS